MHSIMDEFKIKIKQWVDIDNNIRNENEKLQELKKQRSAISEEIQMYAQENNYTNSVIELNDSKLKFVTNKQVQPLTLKYIEQCLHDCIDDEEDINYIIKHIKDSRTYKVSSDIKRYSKKEKE